MKILLVLLPGLGLLLLGYLIGTLGLADILRDFGAQTAPSAAADRMRAVGPVRGAMLRDLLRGVKESHHATVTQGRNGAAPRDPEGAKDDVHRTYPYTQSYVRDKDGRLVPHGGEVRDLLDVSCRPRPAAGGQSVDAPFRIECVSALELRSVRIEQRTATPAMGEPGVAELTVFCPVVLRWAEHTTVRMPVGGQAVVSYLGSRFDDLPAGGGFFFRPERVPHLEDRLLVLSAIDADAAVADPASQPATAHVAVRAQLVTISTAAAQRLPDSVLKTLAGSPPEEGILAAPERVLGSTQIALARRVLSLTDGVQVLRDLSLLVLPGHSAGHTLYREEGYIERIDPTRADGPITDAGVLRNGFAVTVTPKAAEGGVTLNLAFDWSRGALQPAPVAIEAKDALLGQVHYTAALSAPVAVEAHIKARLTLKPGQTALFPLADATSQAMGTLGRAILLIEAEVVR